MTNEKTKVERIYRDAIREYYTHHGEKAKVIRKVYDGDNFVVLCRLVGSDNIDWSTLVMFDYDSKGKLYATEFDHAEQDRENDMIAAFINGDWSDM